MTSAAERSAESSGRLESELRRIERMLIRKAEVLEKAAAVDPRAGSPRDPPPAEGAVFEGTDRIFSALRRHDRAEEILLKEKRRLRQQLEDRELQMEEVQMERDVLLQQVHAYLEVNSSLRVRLEEQRCQAGAVRKHLDSDLESRIRALERDKENLSDLNVRKDREIDQMRAMLGQTTKGLRHRDADVPCRGTEERDPMTSLRRDLQSAFREKSDVQEECASFNGKIFFRDIARRKNVRGCSDRERRSSLKRWSSAGEIKMDFWSFSEQAVLPEPPRPTSPNADFSTSNSIKQEELAASREREGFLVPGSLPLPEESEAKEAADVEYKKESPQSPLYGQLNALGCGLATVARKLEVLKRQLVNSGAMPEDVQRNLKIKTKSSAEEEKDCAELHSGFKNLNNILEDAKNLNVKLQNLRELKQREMDAKRQESVKAQVERKKSDEDAFRHFQEAPGELRKPLEERGDEGRALLGGEHPGRPSSVLSACVFGRLRRSDERSRGTGPGARGETGARLSTDEGSNRSDSAEGKPEENGGGDNLLNSPILGDRTTSPELKTQIATLNSKFNTFLASQRRNSDD